MFWQILSNAEKQDWPEESNHKINHIHATSLLWDLFVIISFFKNIIFALFFSFHCSNLYNAFILKKNVRWHVTYEEFIYRLCYM